MTKKFTWKPDLPDQRDHIFSIEMPEGLEALPSLPTKTDLRPKCSPVEDQGELGSCTGNAIVGAMEYLENLQAETFINLSRLFVYYNERVIENTVNQDSGAMIRDGIKSVVSMGVCKETTYPYVPARFKRKPTKAAYKDALKHTATEYSRVTSLDDLKAALASGFPVVFGFTVYDSFMSDEVAKTGKVPMPAKTEQVQGGHAVLCVGYDDDMQCAIIRNSWGSAWGDGGYFYMPYAYIGNLNLCDDFWVIKKTL